MDRCQRCNDMEMENFIDYNISPVILCAFLNANDDTEVYDPRSFELKDKLRKQANLPAIPANNYDMEEVIDKMNDIKNYNIGMIKIFTKAEAFTESVCYHIIENKVNNGYGYIFFSQQAEELALLKGTLYLNHYFSLDDLEKVVKIFQSKFGDRFHWIDQESLIIIHLLPL